jgi:hypothetical protein
MWRITTCSTTFTNSRSSSSVEYQYSISFTYDPFFEWFFRSYRCKKHETQAVGREGSKEETVACTGGRPAGRVVVLGIGGEVSARILVRIVGGRLGIVKKDIVVSENAVSKSITYIMAVRESLSKTLLMGLLVGMESTKLKSCP